MELITNNPYRQLGLLVGATARQESNHKTKIKQYLEAEQEIPIQYIEYGFECLGKIQRTTNSISDAASSLNLDADKMKAAIFWFYKGNDITDEPAFDTLKESEYNQAYLIWKKLTATGIVTAKNASAFQNLSNLYLSDIPEVKDTSKHFYEQGISLKLKFLESDFVKDFKALATDETYKTTKNELQLLFLNEIYSEIEKQGGSYSNKFLEILLKQEFTAKNEYLNNFAQNIVAQIQIEIDKAKQKRKENKANGIKIGKDLNSKTIVNLSSVKSLIGESNIKYIAISDKVSEEILQCGIDYFKHYKDSNTDPSKETLELFYSVQKFAIGNLVKQRCEENIENLQEWIEDKPERDKLKSIEADLNSLIDLLETFEKRSDTIENAKSLINQSKPFLNNIKSILGVNDDVYIKLSTRTAIIAQHNIIEEVNNAQENLDMKLAIDRLGTINRLKSTLKNAFDVTILLGTLDMEFDFKKNRYQTNKESLKGLCEQLGVSTSNNNLNVDVSKPISIPKPTPTYTPSSGSDTSDNTGCIVLIIVFVVIGFIIAMVSQSSNSSNSNNYSSTDSTVVAVDSTVVDTTSVTTAPDFSKSPEVANNEVVIPESKYKGNQLSDGASPLNQCFGKGKFRGNAWIKFDNSNLTDAIVCLVNVNTGKTIRNEYIRHLRKNPELAKTFK